MIISLVRCKNLMSTVSKKIYFYYPSQGVGGVQILFLKLSFWISKNLDVTVFIIDYDEGYMAKNRGEGVRLLPAGEICDLNSLNYEVILIAPLSEILFLEDMFGKSENVTIFYWCLHPENLIDIIRGAQRLRKLGVWRDKILKVFQYPTWSKIRYRLKACLDEQRVFFMDRPNLLRTSSFYRIDINPVQYLPVATDVTENDILPQPKGKDSKIHILWMGRLSKDKIKSLEYLVRCLAVSRYVDQLVLHVIGTGEYWENFQTVKNDSRLMVQTHGIIENSIIREFLIDNKIICSFGMGTSVLETAKHGVPSAIIDPSFIDYEEDYKPTWIGETIDYNLGSFVHGSGSASIDEMLDKVLYEWEELSVKSYKYVRNNHELGSVASLLLGRVGRDLDNLSS